MYVVYNILDVKPSPTNGLPFSLITMFFFTPYLLFTTCPFSLNESEVVENLEFHELLYVLNLNYYTSKNEILSLMLWKFFEDSFF